MFENPVILILLLIIGVGEIIRIAKTLDRASDWLSGESGMYLTLTLASLKWWLADLERELRHRDLDPKLFLNDMNHLEVVLIKKNWTKNKLMSIFKVLRAYREGTHIVARMERRWLTLLTREWDTRDLAVAIANVIAAEKELDTLRDSNDAKT